MPRPPSPPEALRSFPPRERWLAAGLVLTAGGLALVSLLPFARGYLPVAAMPPIVADSVLLLGVTVIILNWRHRIPGWRPIAATTAGLLVIGHTLLARPTGPIVAGSAILLAVVVLLIALTQERRVLARAGGLAVALLLLLMHVILLLGQHFGVPLLTDPVAQPAAWPVSLAFAALSLALVITCGVTRWVYRDMLGETPANEMVIPVLVRRQRRRAVFVLASIAGVAVAFGYAFLERQMERHWAEVAAKLTETADLKVAQVEAWLQERRADTRVLARAPFVHGDRELLAGYLEEFRRAYGYRDAIVLDSAGRTLAAAPDREEGRRGHGADPVTPLTPVLENEGENLLRAADGAVIMEFVAPVRGAVGATAGAVVLRMAARETLFPIVAVGAGAGATVETYLVRREGLTVSYLSDLRFRADAAFRLRHPLGQPGLPAAIAVIERQVALEEGVDYRGQPVLWLARPVGGTAWVLLAKVDHAEAFAEVRSETWMMTGGFAAGLLAVGLLVGNYWRDRQRWFERKHAEAELERRGAVERLALVLRHANDVILLFDADLRIVETNDRALEVYGYTHPEMQRLTVADLRTEEAGKMLGTDLSRELAGTGLTLESEHRRKDGTAFPVEISARAVEIEGRPHVLAIIRDITRRKQIENELKRQEARFRFIFEHLPVGVSLRTLHGNIDVNHAHVRLTGVAAADSNQPGVFARATHPDDYARQRQFTERFKRGEIDRFTLEKRYLHPDGRVVWVEFTSHWFVEATTGKKQALTTLTDITERKAAEEELRAREEIFSSIVGQAMDAIVLLDVTTQRFVEFNRVAHENYGYTREEFATFAISDIQAEYSAGQIKAIIGRILHEGSASFETRHRHRQGEVRDVRLSARKLTLRGQDYIAAIWSDITEAKRLNRNLQASEERQRALFENMDLGVVYQDAAGNITDANPAASRILGLTVDQMRGRTSIDPRWRAVREDGSPFPGGEHPAMVALRTGVRVTDVVMGIRTDPAGPTRWILISAVPEFQPGASTPHRAFVVFADITERKHAQQALQASEAKFRRLLQMVPLPLSHTDKDGLITFTNQRFQRLFGYTVAEVPTIAQWWQRAYPDPQYRDALVAMWDRALRQAVAGRGEIPPLETNVTCGDGQVRTVEISGMILGDELLVTFVDLTERVKAERKLRQLSRIIEQAPLAVVITDLSGAIEYANPRFCEVSGYTLDELLDRNPRLLKSGRTPPEAYTQMWETLTRGEIWRGELCNRKKDGTLYHERAVIAPVTDESGSVTHYVALKEDITEWKRRDEALKESRDRLVKAEQIARLGNWTLDLATNQVTWSDEMYRLLELDPATTTPSVELYHSFMAAADRDLLQRRFAEALATRQRFVLGTRLTLRSGQVKYAEGTGEVIVDAAGQPVRAIGTVQDVTERRLIEIELRELVKGLRVLRAISQALEQRDLERAALLALVVRELPAAMTHPGDARAEIVIEGEQKAAGATGEVLARLTVPITINDRLAGEVAVGYVRPHAPADEGPFHVREREVLESIARTIGLGLGEQESFAAVQRFNAELEGRVAARTSELAARSRQIQSLLSAIPDTVMRLRTDGTVLFAQQAPGSPPLAAVTPVPGHPATHPATAALLAACVELGRQALSANDTAAADIDLATPAGPLAIELRSAPVGSGEFVVYGRDISVRKRFDAELQAMLTKEREVSEMKTRFISLTSHEFRTPMAAALGSVELLHNHADRITPAKREELFRRIFGSLRRMTEMLDDVLLLNRMDANRLAVQPSTLNLRAFVQGAVDDARLADRDAHRFELAADGELEGIASDPNLLHHILSNLLSNALRYSPAGTTVTVRVAGTPTGVELTVTDEGIGIPEADRERIFEPFERGSNVGQIKGTGLGLNIVKRMTDRLGGTIAFADAGRGTSFRLTLPRQTPPASPP